MKKRSVLLVAVLLVLAVPVFAQTPNPASDFEYKLNQAGNGVVITKYTGTRADVVIPAEIGGFPVVEIQGGTDNTWLNRTHGLGRNGEFEDARITSVVFPNTNISIGPNAFKGSGLISVTLPETIINIRENAFIGCSKLNPESQAALRKAGYTGNF
jgi:hypothetical protein